MGKSDNGDVVDPSIEKQDQGLGVAQGNEYVQHERIPPKSHTCCGCCCDTRRAVIIVNIISLSFAALSVFTLSMLASNRGANNFDDDEIQDAFDAIGGSTAFGIGIGIAIGIAVVGMICYACGIYGAYKFHKVFIIIAAVWHSANFILNIVSLNVGGAVMTGFFLYPHVVFYQEVSKGIMSPASYPQEQQCCNF
eukprot:scaffold8707_cov69-Cylindrotheca_fusiformis.AAC.1